MYVFQNRIQIQELLWQLIWNKYLLYNSCMDNQWCLLVILLWKVDLEVIVNSPSCLSLDSQVMIRSWQMFLIRDVLTVDLDLLLSLYSLDRSSSDVEPSSTEGSSWRYSGEPGTGWSSPFITPWSGMWFRVLARDVVEQWMSHQRLEPLPPCSFHFFPGNNPFHHGLLTEIQYASGA